MANQKRTQSKNQATIALGTTPQEKFWATEFGTEYIARNLYPTTEKLDAFYRANYGIARSTINKNFLGKLKLASILEVGCSTGNQLIALQKQGFKNLYGIEINPNAIQLAKKYSENIHIMPGSAFDIPFKDKHFDLVFTSGVLIHINPKDLPKALKEIHRVSKRYIWGFEYFSLRPQAITYRGHKDRLWKRDFAVEYLKRFPDLRLAKEQKYPYTTNTNADAMFLLKKK